MRRSTLFLIMIVAFSLVASGVVLANPDPEPPSNSADVTGGIFQEANDLFLSPTRFGMVESNLLFLQFDMPSATIANEGIEVGAAGDLFDMYTAGYLRLVFQGINGQLGFGDSMVTSIDEAFLVDGGGVITGKTEERTVQVDYDVDSLVDARLLVGLGPMGIGLSVVHDVSNGYGNYTATGSVPGGTTWPGIGVGTVDATAVTFTTFDAAGDLVETDVEQYGLGTDKTSSLDFTARFGMPLDPGESLDLAVGADLLIGLGGNGESALYETYHRTVGAPTAITYTPEQTVDGSDPAAIEDTTTYTFEEGKEVNGSLLIEPELYGDVAFALNEMVTAKGRVAYTPSVELYRAGYTDASGEDGAVWGTADTFASVDVETAVNPSDPTLTQITTTTVDAWETTAISGMTNTLDLEVGVEMVPSDRFRFGVMYAPSFEYEFGTNRYDGELVEYVIVDNGDGEDGPGDSVTRTTLARSGYSTSTRSFTISGTFNTGAQFFLMPERLRVNLGAQVDNTILDRTLTETVTDGAITRTEDTALDTTDPSTDTYVNTDYQFSTGIRADPDDQQTLEQLGVSELTYDAGLTFFFDENMFLDLRMSGAGGNIWDTGEWSLEMTILY